MPSLSPRKKTRKSRNQTFLALFNFTGFLSFVPNILSEIVPLQRVPRRGATQKDLRNQATPGLIRDA